MSQSPTPLDYSTPSRKTGPCCRWAVSSAASHERVGIMLVRIIVGIVFVAHGYQKWFVYGPTGTVKAFGGMGFPPIAAYMAMTAELGCGLLLVLGLFTRFAAIPIIITMIVAIVKVHLPNGFFLPTGYEFPLTLGVTALGLAFAGPGTCAVDNLIARRR